MMLNGRPSTLRLILPSICLMEALTVFEGERKRHGRRLELFGEQLAEVKRNLTSERVPSLFGHLNQARTETDELFKEYTARLFEALDTLGSEAELIHPSPEILIDSRRNVFIDDDPTDNLILACILDHSRRHPSNSKVFLSENRRDFDTNQRANRALRESGVRYFADASKFLQWHRARPEE